MRSFWLLVLAVGCGTPAAATNTPAPVASAPASASAAHHEKARPPAPGAVVTVQFDGRQVDVDLAKAAKGAASTTLLDLWKEAFPTEDGAKLTFDLVGTDGFRPTSHAPCTHLLSWTELGNGKVEVTSHNVSWEETLNMAKCYRVKALNRIEAKK